MFNKSGWRFYQNGEMIFENARVPHANVVGDVGHSYRERQRRRRHHRRRSVRRSSCPPTGSASVDDACATTLKFAKTEKQGGPAVQQQQNVQLQINKMFTVAEALRSFVMRVACGTT